MFVQRIVFPDKILRYRNTFIIIIDYGMTIYDVSFKKKMSEFFLVHEVEEMKTTT